MKNRLSFLILISCSLMHIPNSYAFNEYASDFDDEDETSGIVGFVKRHKILTAVAATASCASIVIYNNQTSWNWVVDSILGIKTVGSEVWQGLTSKDNTQNQKQNQTKDPVVTPSQEKSKPKVDEPKVDEPVSIDDQNKNRPVKSDPVYDYLVRKQKYAEALKIMDDIASDVTIDWDGKNGLPADLRTEVKMRVNNLEHKLKKVIALKGQIPEQQAFLECIQREMEMAIAQRENLNKLSSTDDEVSNIYQIRPHFDRILKKWTKAKGEFKKIIKSEIVDGRPAYFFKKGEIIQVSVASTLAAAATYLIIKYLKKS